MTDQQPEEQPEQRSPIAGACVLLALAGAAVAVVWAASPEAAVLLLWAAGATAVWWAARHRKGTDQPLPSPTERAPHTGLDLHESRKAAQAATDPNGVMHIVHAPAGETSEARSSQ